MNRRFALVVALLLAGFALVAPGVGQASHVQCGDSITQDTTLDSDILDCTGQALTIGADSITLDLSGHVVDGIGSEIDSGIVNPGYDGVVIQDGTVQEFRTAIRLIDADANVVRGVSATYNVGGGIILINTSNSLISDNVVGNPRGNDNGVDTQDVGIGVADGSSDNVVRDNFVIGHNSSGIIVGNAASTVIERNTVVENAIRIRPLDFVGSGILVLSGIDTQITKNTVVDNDNDGVHVGSGIGVVAGTIIEKNRVDRNWDDGIDVDNGSAVVSHNRARFNGDLGIEAGPGVGGTGNKTSGNGNPLQCLNIECK